MNGISLRARIAVYARLLALLSVLFAVVYPLCNWLAARRARTWALYADWELSIPFVPALIYGYASIALLFVLPLFTLDAARMRALARAFALATLAGAACFLLLPAHLGFARPAAVEDHGLAYRLLFAADLPHNMVPSLHVAFSTLVVLATGDARSWRWRVGLGAWLALIIASVVLVHQHHLLDVVTGLALGWASYRHYLRLSLRTADAAAGSGSSPSPLQPSGFRPPA